MSHNVAYHGELTYHLLVFAPLSSLTLTRSKFHTFVAVALALNYFAFQVELCEEEYEAMHPVQSEDVSFTAPSLNWETFDKTNAPQAFVVDAGIACVYLFSFSSVLKPISVAHLPGQIVRDKSPPSASST